MRAVLCPQQKSLFFPRFVVECGQFSLYKPVCLVPSANPVSLNFWWLMTPSCHFIVSAKDLFKSSAHLHFCLTFSIECNCLWHADIVSSSVFCLPFPSWVCCGGDWATVYMVAVQGCAAKPRLRLLFFPQPSLFINIFFVYLYNIFVHFGLWYEDWHWLTFQCYTKLAFGRTNTTWS